jgi:glycosyltransferase involved in cell wall biosynthesis
MNLPRVLILVNGSNTSAMGHRASALTTPLHSQFHFHFEYRGADKRASLKRFLNSTSQFRPHLTYVFDMAASGVLAGGLQRLWRRGKLIIDTGDAISALARAIGRDRLGLVLTQALELFSFFAADHLVVRGSYHRELLAERGIRSTFIPDGVEIDQFQSHARDNNGSTLTIGLIGSTIWNPRTQTCYGSELLELLDRLREYPLKAILIGDGSGLQHLKQRASDLNLSDRIEFLGHLPYQKLPEAINRFDVAISTQTNDLPGQVRTTGKLPLYLACDRFVLASRVGEAARLLPEEMLIDYEGAFDPYYPAKLSERLRHLGFDPRAYRVHGRNRALAVQNFDYAVLSTRFADCLHRVLDA